MDMEEQVVPGYVAHTAWTCPFKAAVEKVQVHAH